MHHPPYMLVIDDEPGTGEMLSYLLAPHRVETVQSVQAARRVLEADPPDVVILDIMLPDTDGLTFLPELRERYPGIPVIIVTAYGTTERAIEALRRGACDFVPAPYRPQEMKASVERALEIVRRSEEHFRDEADTGAAQAIQQASIMQGIWLAGHLTQGFSHDIRNPLSIIRLNAELVALTAELDPANRKRLEAILRAVGSIHRALDVLRVFPDAADDTLQLLSLGNMATLAVESLRRSGYLISHRVEMALSPDLPPVMVRPDQVWQAIHNILLFGEEAVTHPVTQQCDRRVYLKCRAEDESVWLEVRYPAECLAVDSLLHVLKIGSEALFDRDNVAGLGLGILAGRTLIEANGGRLELDCEPGREDVTFRVVLPVSRAA